jgi:hypothetical protein
MRPAELSRYHSQNERQNIYGVEPIKYPKLTKIGISVCPEQRASDISLDLQWCNMDVLFEYRSTWARDIEYALHRQYKDKRVQMYCTGGSEFFLLNGCEILICINTILTHAKKPKWIK